MTATALRIAIAAAVVRRNVLDEGGGVGEESGDVGGTGFALPNLLQHCVACCLLVLADPMKEI